MYIWSLTDIKVVSVQHLNLSVTEAAYIRTNKQTDRETQKAKKKSAGTRKVSAD